jgi:hypothetical protein
MLVKQIRPCFLLKGIAFAFSASSHPRPAPSSDPVPPSKHNPHASKDLRGHHNLDELTPSEQALSPLHSTRYHHFSAYHLCSFLP